MIDRREFGRAADDSLLGAGVSLPPEVANAPGMLSRAERQMLYGIVRDHYTGRGAIIDGGSFFGSSLASSAQGLRDNPAASGSDFSSFPDQRPIHAYELGVLPAPSGKREPETRMFGSIRYTMGESFVPILEGVAQPYADLARLHIGDFNQEAWPLAPIEVAFIDVCKTPDLNAHVTKTFFPHLLSGAIVINQDFFFDRLPFIKVTMGYLSEYFDWVGRVATSSVYIARKPIPIDVASYDPFLHRDPRCLEFHDAYPRDQLDDATKLRMDLSRAYLMAVLGDKEGATTFAASLRDRYPEAIAESRARMAIRDKDRGGPIRDAEYRISRAITHIRLGRV